MSNTAILWSTLDRSRWFLVVGAPPPGSTSIRSVSGELECVDPDWLLPFEISEAQAQRWAKEELGHTLEELKAGLDQKLADLRRQLEEKDRTPVTEESTVTPNAATAVFDLLKKLPGVIGNSLSGDEKRVESAKTTMADLQRELKEAGIDLDQRFTNFPERLAELRRDLPRKPD